MTGLRVLGLTGGAFRARFQGRCALSALTRRPIASIPCQRADIVDLDAIRPAFRDVDVVVHLTVIAQDTPPSRRFGVFFAVSDNTWSYRDLEHARAVLGCDPQDRAEDYR